MQIRKTRFITSRTNKLQRLFMASLFLTAGFIATPAQAATAPPSTPNMTDNTDSGSSFTDNVTNINQPTFTGTGIPLAFIQLYSGSTAIGAGVVNSNGQWTLNSSTKLADGVSNITAKQTYGGAQSAASGTLNIAIDTVAPSVSVPDLTATSDHGRSNIDNVTNLTTPTFSGTGTANATVKLFNTTIADDYQIGSGSVSAQGIWSAAVTTPFPSGVHAYNIAARTVDQAGNVSNLMGWVNVTIDTTIPDKGAVPDLVAASDSGFSETDDHTNVVMPTFAVKAEPYSTIKLIRYATVEDVIGTAIADGNGNATITATTPIPEGYFNIFVKVDDQAGNSAAAISPSFVLQIDTTAPAITNTPTLAPDSNSASPYDTITNLSSPVINGHVYAPYADEPAHLKMNFFAGVFNYTASSPVTNGDFSITAPGLPSGIYDVTVSNTDEAGNVSISPALKLTIDSGLPLVTIAAPAAGTVISSLPAISGTATDYWTGVDQVLCVLTRSSDGYYWNGTNWSPAIAPITLSLNGTDWVRSSGLPSGANLPFGDYNLMVWCNDLAGNLSPNVNRAFTVGNTAPSNLSVTPAALASNAGTAKTLTAVYTDENGALDFKNANIQVRATSGGSNALYATYDAVANKLYLQNDANTAALGGFAPGSNNVITNSQGSLNCASTTVVRSGNTLTIDWNFTPSAAYVGLKNVYLYSRDLANAADGFDDRGDWLIKGASNTAPVNVSVTPASLSSNAGTAKTLTAVYTDADNALDIKTAYIQVRASSGGTNALYATYDSVANKLYLQNDVNSLAVGGFAPGSNNVITNSQGSLNCAATTVVRSGDTLTIKWSFTPSNAYAGLKNVYLYVRDTANAADGFDDLGDWNIIGTPPIKSPAQFATSGASS